MFKFFKIASKLIGRLPLCGRLAIKPLLIKTYSASGTEKKSLVFASYLLLTFFVLMHFLQAKLGYDLFCSKTNIAIQLFMLLYATINVLVTYAQFFLLCRLSIHCLKNRNMFRGGYVHKPFNSNFSFAQTAVFLVVTMSGQIMFLTLQLA